MDLIEELANEFLFSSTEMTSVLNRATGEILLASPESVTSKSQIDWDDESADDLIQIPQITSQEAYDIRMLFAKQQESAAGAMLRHALNGKKPFRDFKAQVENFYLDSSWYRFEQQYAKKRMAKWLEDQGINPARFQ